MGYRNYIGIIEKSKINDLMACKTVEDEKAVYNKYGWEYDEDSDGEVYFSNSDLDYREDYELGKYVSLNEDVHNSLTDIFSKDSPLYCKDTEFKVGDEKFLLALIENYRIEVKTYFESLQNKSLEELKDAVEDKLFIWGEPAERRGGFTYNLKKNSDKIVDSWFYEYAIFELVRIYKSFNPETEVVVYYGH